LIINNSRSKNNFNGAGIEPLSELFFQYQSFFDIGEKASGESPVLFFHSSPHNKTIEYNYFFETSQNLWIRIKKRNSILNQIVLQSRDTGSWGPHNNFSYQRRR